MLVRLARLLRAAGRDIALLWRACRHPDAPRSLKIGALLLAIYIVSPIDLIPDWLPFIGWLDDTAVLAIAIPLLLKLAPRHILDGRPAGDPFFRART